MFADPLGLSQLTASFIAAECQGILRMPFLHSVIPTSSNKNHSSPAPAVSSSEGDIPISLSLLTGPRYAFATHSQSRLSCHKVVTLLSASLHPSPHVSGSCAQA